MSYIWPAAKRILSAALARVPAPVWRALSNIWISGATPPLIHPATSRLIILDPSYKSSKGHHHALNRLIIDSCQGSQIIASVLASRYLDQDLLDPFVHRLFRCNVYSTNSSPAEFLERQLRTQNEVLVDLALGGAGSWRSETTIIVHTATAIEISAILLSLHRLKATCTVNVFLMLPPEYGNSIETTALSENLYMKIYALADKLHFTVRFWCESLTLVNRFRGVGLMSARFCSLPSAMPACSESWPTATSRTIVFLVIGDARTEKGLELIARTVPRLADAKVRIRIRFVLTSLPKALKNILEEYSPGIVELQVLPFIPNDTYFQAIAQADYTLLAYDPVQYRTKNSNIVAETISMGTPAIVSPGPNSLVDFLENFASGCFIEMQSYDEFGLMTSIMKAIVSADALRESTRRCAAVVRHMRDPKRFLSCMV